jgi:thiol-disulfide isomerase/thioredoxin
VIAAAVALGGWAGCHRSATVDRPSDASTANATIVVRGLDAGWKASTIQALPIGNSGRLFGRSSPKFESRRTDEGLSIGCPHDAVCQLALQHESGATIVLEVVSAESIVEVEPASLERKEIPVGTKARYLRPTSRSARIAKLLDEELALAHACGALSAGKCGTAHVLPDPRRVVAGHDPQAAVDRLRAVVTSADETLATWAYFNVGCQHSPLDAELAREALREPIEPIALNLWPVGIARALLAAEGASGAEQRLASMRGPADRDVAAALLIELVNDARGRHDLERAAELRNKLQRTTGPWTESLLVNRISADRQVVGVAVGSLMLRTLAGETRDVAEMKGAPILLYTAASWCTPCTDGLPELRDVAAKYPELVVLYVMLDDADPAAEYVRDHAPIPGTAVVAAEAERSKLEVLLGTPAFPSFVIIDRDGRVAALPGEEDLDTVVQKSGVLAKR